MFSCFIILFVFLLYKWRWILVECWFVICCSVFVKKDIVFVLLLLIVILLLMNLFCDKLVIVLFVKFKIFCFCLVKYFFLGVNCICWFFCINNVMFNFFFNFFNCLDNVGCDICNCLAVLLIVFFWIIVKK